MVGRRSRPASGCPGSLVPPYVSISAGSGISGKRNTFNYIEFAGFLQAVFVAVFGRKCG
jgi:hypothetical protein